MTDSLTLLTRGRHVRRTLQIVLLAIGIGLLSRSASAQIGGAMAGIMTELPPRIALEVLDLGRRATQELAAGRTDRAITLLKQELQLLEAVDESHPLRLAVTNDLALALKDSGDFKRARRLFRRVVRLARDSDPPQIKLETWARTNLAIVQLEMGHPRAAERTLARAIREREDDPSWQPRDRARGLNVLAAMRFDLGDYGGTERACKRALEIQSGALPPDDPDLALSLGNLGALARVRGRFDEAEELLQRALDLRSAALGQNHAELAPELMGLGDVALAQGRYELAATYYDRALRILESSGRGGGLRTVLVLQNLALVERYRGNIAAAERSARAAIERAEQIFGPSSPRVAFALANLAQIFLEIGDQGRAAAYARRSAEILERVPIESADRATLQLQQARLDLAVGAATAGTRAADALIFLEQRLGRSNLQTIDARIIVAWILLESGSTSDAATRADEAVTDAQLVFGPASTKVAEAMLVRAATLEAQGSFAAAAADIERVSAIFAASLPPNHPWRANALGALARVLRKAHRPDEALAASRRAVAIIDRATRLKPTVSALGRRARGGWLSIIDVHLRLLEEQRRRTPSDSEALVAEAFVTMQLGRTSPASDAMLAMAARWAGDDPRSREEVRALQETVARATTVNDLLLEALARPPTLRDEAQTLDARRSRLEERLRGTVPALSELSLRQPQRLAAVRAALQPDEALLVHLVTSARSHVVVVRREGNAELYSVPVGASALRRWVSRLRRGLDQEGVRTTRELRPFPTPVAERLYARLLAPSAAAIGDARQLVLSLDGALSSLPPAVLVTRHEALDASGEVAWFDAHHALVITPSVGAFRALRDLRSAVAAKRPFVGFGAPTLRAVRPPPVADGALDATAGLSDLAQTGPALQRIATELGGSSADVFLGPRATVDNLEALDLSAIGVLAFATHALFPRGDTSVTEPALVLSPSPAGGPTDRRLLTESAIRRLHLRADWVVLLACNTAQSSIPSTPGITGLAQAFFFAGAHSLLVSHWPVDAQATIALIERTIAEYARDPGATRAIGLQRAMHSLRSDPAFRHPALWAPFVVVGDGGVPRSRRQARLVDRAPEPR